MRPRPRRHLWRDAHSAHTCTPPCGVSEKGERSDEEEEEKEEKEEEMMEKEGEEGEKRRRERRNSFKNREIQIC